MDNHAALDMRLPPTAIVPFLFCKQSRINLILSRPPIVWCIFPSIEEFFHIINEIVSNIFTLYFPPILLIKKPSLGFSKGGYKDNFWAVLEVVLLKHFALYMFYLVDFMHEKELLLQHTHAIKC